MHLDRAAEHTPPPVCQPRRVSAVDRERGDAAKHRGLLAHTVLLLRTGHAPAVESIHAASKPYWMFRKVERILPSISMRSNKALLALEHFWGKALQRQEWAFCRRYPFFLLIDLLDISW
jgi:hypothetical protein